MPSRPLPLAALSLPAFLRSPGAAPPPAPVPAASSAPSGIAAFARPAYDAALLKQHRVALNSGDRVAACADAMTFQAIGLRPDAAFIAILVCRTRRFRRPSVSLPHVPFYRRWPSFNTNYELADGHRISFAQARACIQ